MAMKIAGISAVLALSVLSSTSWAKEAEPVFTPEQEARIGKIAENYLLAHPEVLVKVSQKLHAQQEAEQMAEMTTKVAENRSGLLNEPGTPVIGPSTARVAVIEFFDYQCVYCSKLAPEMEKVMKANPDVRFFFKEWPIFGNRWKVSQDAASTGLSIWKTAGADSYLNYHNSIYRTGHVEGDLTPDDVKKAAASAGGKELDIKDKTIADTLDKTSKLAESIGFSGTPGLIVMPIGEATPERITVLPGAVPASEIQSAIKKASQ